MRVLFVSSEIHPLAKTGGLADVSAALPQALYELGVDIRLIMPGYPAAMEAAVDKTPAAVLTGAHDCGAVRLVAARTPDTGLPLWLLDCPALFGRGGSLYQSADGRDWHDNAERFAFFARVAAGLAHGEILPDWRADVVHSNDWHTGLLPLYLRERGAVRPATLFTVHNLAYQGQFPATVLPSLAVAPEYFNESGLEFYGDISLLKAGIRYSDAISTVSPSYAREIQTPEGGAGLHGLLQERSGQLSGILNGVDYRVWDPARDPHLAHPYNEADVGGKRACKAALQREVGLAEDRDAPLLAYMSRLTSQKMTDVLIDALPALMERGVQFALLGQGDAQLQARLKELALNWPGRASISIGYDEPRAHRLLAGADMLLHPSLFEPCGLTQLYALHYGTVPVVRRVGGLADTVVDADRHNRRKGIATGFSFDEPSAGAMLDCVDRALALYRQPVAWRRLQRQGMTRDFGWDASARQYLDLYHRLAPQAAEVGLPALEQVVE